MDTTWSAVDENNEIALFDTGPEGVIPVPPNQPDWLHSPEPISELTYMESGYPGAIGLHRLRRYSKEIIALDEFMAWPPEPVESIEPTTKGFTKPVVVWPMLLFKSWDYIPEEMINNCIFESSHGPIYIEFYIVYSEFQRLIAEGRLQRVWTRSPDPEHTIEDYAGIWTPLGLLICESANCCSSYEPYYPDQIPPRPILIDDLPEPLRKDVATRRIPNYCFRDREAWNPYETFTNCFSHRREHIYKGADLFTCFPIPNRRRLWNERDLFEAYYNWEWEMSDDGFYPRKYGLDSIYRKRFFATDAAGRIALFAANPFGAYPAKLQTLLTSMPWDAPEPWLRFLKGYSVSPHAGALSYNFTGLEEMPPEIFEQGKGEDTCRLPGPFLAQLTETLAGREYSENLVRIPILGVDSASRFLCSSYGQTTYVNDDAELESFDKVEKIWWAGWAMHWMEYPFGPITPRRLGFYHYDMCFLHAGPYARIAMPAAPAHIKDLTEDLIQLLDPVHLPNVDFEEMVMIQPMEHYACLADAPFWLDADLAHVLPVSGFKEPLDAARESRILRRARAHYQMIAELKRK